LKFTDPQRTRSLFFKIFFFDPSHHKGQLILFKTHLWSCCHDAYFMFYWVIFEKKWVGPLGDPCFTYRKKGYHLLKFMPSQKISTKKIHHRCVLKRINWFIWWDGSKKNFEKKWPGPLGVRKFQLLFFLYFKD